MTTYYISLCVNAQVDLGATWRGVVFAMSLLQGSCINTSLSACDDYVSVCVNGQVDFGAAWRGVVFVMSIAVTFVGVYLIQVLCRVFVCACVGGGGLGVNPGGREGGRKRKSKGVHAST